MFGKYVMDVVLKIAFIFLHLTFKLTKVKSW